MQTAATSVVSAAVIGGDLILGLSDGGIINCGRVQGPQGLKGDQGPMGATGRAGTDGNTIHTVAGAPDTTLGKDGDFAINTVVWEIYGPRAGGVWGTGTPLRGNKRGGRESKDPIFGMGSGEDGSGGGRAYNTANLPLAGTGRAHTAPGGNIIPIGNNLVFQSNLNRWIIDSLTALDEALPVSVGDVLPDEGEYQGDLFLKDGILYVYAKGGWIAVGGEGGPPAYVGEDEPPGTPQTGELWYCTDEKYLTLFIYTGTTWAPAAPPVSLDGIESSITGIVERLDEGEVKQDALTERVSDGEAKQRQIELSLEELSITKGSVARYTVTETHIGAAIRNGELYVSSPNAADVKAISFAPFDINGQPTRPANTGDIIEFVEVVRDVGQVTRYRIVDGGDSQALVVDYISGNNNFAKGENEEVYIYPQNEEGVSKDYVDGLDELNVKKAGSTMTGDLCFDGGSHSIRMLSGTKLRFTGSDPGGNQRTFIDIKNELSSGVQGDEDGYRMRLYHLSDPDNPYHAANKKYVDESIAAIPSVDLDGYATEQYVDDAISNINVTGDYLPLSGGELTGSFSINKGDKPHAQWKITPNGSDNYATNIYNLGNGEMRFRTSHTDAEAGHKGSHIVLSPNGGNPQTKIYNVVPAGDTTAVPKSYVDNAVASVSAPPTGPATLAWEWRNHDTLSDPGEGKVAWYSASQIYRLNLKSANGVDLGKNRIAPKDHSFSTKPYGSIWTYVNGGWQLIKMFDIGRIQWNKYDCVWIYSSATHLGGNNFTAGQKYYFTVGGFF